MSVFEAFHLQTLPARFQPPSTLSCRHFNLSFTFLKLNASFRGHFGLECLPTAFLGKHFSLELLPHHWPRWEDVHMFFTDVTVTAVDVNSKQPAVSSSTPKSGPCKQWTRIFRWMFYIVAPILFHKYMLFLKQVVDEISYGHMFVGLLCQKLLTHTHTHVAVTIAMIIMTARCDNMGKEDCCCRIPNTRATCAACCVRGCSQHWHLLTRYANKSWNKPKHPRAREHRNAHAWCVAGGLPWTRFQTYKTADSLHHCRDSPCACITSLENSSSGDPYTVWWLASWLPGKTLWPWSGRTSYAKHGLLDKQHARSGKAPHLNSREQKARCGDRQSLSRYTSFSLSKHSSAGANNLLQPQVGASPILLDFFCLRKRASRPADMLVTKPIPSGHLRWRGSTAQEPWWASRQHQWPSFGTNRM